MLNFGNKEFRNLQEQVLKNMADIQDIHEGVTVLGEFGIKVVGQVNAASDLPNPTEYDGEYGDAYVVGEETPYDYYIFTRPFEDETNPQWFNLGQFPAPGPQGEQGPQGATGYTPTISMAIGTVSTLSPGQYATANLVRVPGSPDRYPLFNLSLGIPQGAQGIQGVQGAQGPEGPQGPQGIQGQKGDTGYLYTIVGQVSNESSLPLPGQLPRTSAYLVGAHEPYDVYIIVGQDTYDLEWINIGPIATVVPTTYIASNVEASSGTLDSSTLAAIRNETGVHYLKVGSDLYEFANTYNGNSYYMSLRYDTSISKDQIARMIVALSSGAWTIGVDTVPNMSNTVFTDVAQDISGEKTFTKPVTIYTAINNTKLVQGSDQIKFYYNNNAVSDIAFATNGDVSVTGNFIPATTNSFSLGTSSYKWKDLWLNGYLRDGTNSVLVSDIVTRATAQTITGTKTFRSMITGDISASGSGLILGNSDSDEYIKFNKNGTIDIHSEASAAAKINIYGENEITIGSDEIYIDGGYTNIKGGSITIGDDETESSDVSLYPGSGHALHIYNLPNSDPEGEDRVWSNNGVLCLSGATGLNTFSQINFTTGASLSNNVFIDTDSEATASPAQLQVHIHFQVLDEDDEWVDLINPISATLTLSASDEYLALNTRMLNGYVNASFPSLIRITGNDYATLRAANSVFVTIEAPTEHNYLLADNDDNVYEWVKPVIGVKTEKDGRIYDRGMGGIQTPVEVDGPYDTYDFTNLSFSSGYSEPAAAANRGFIIGLYTYNSSAIINYITYEAVIEEAEY